MKPSNVFSESPSICCEHCGKELLQDNARGIIVTLSEIESDHIDSIYFSCKGECDRALRHQYDPDNQMIDRWDDFKLDPHVWLRNLMAWLNGFHKHKTMSDDAFSKYKKYLLNTHPFICRDLTEEEKTKINEYYAQGFQDYL